MNLKSLFQRFLIEETFIEEDQQPANQNQGQRKISDEQAQQIAQGLQSGEIKEEEIKQAYNNGQLTDADIQAIQNYLNQNQDNTSESQFEQEISKITDSIIRLNFYDRINKLKQKIENIMDLNTKINTEKFEHIYNYLDILLALVYSLDINILYQLYIALEIKTIEYIKQELGLNTDEEKRLQIALEIEGEKQDLKNKYTPDYLVQQLTLLYLNQLSEDDKKQLEKDIEKLIALQIYSPEQIEDFKQQAQQQAQSANSATPDQSQMQNQGQPESNTQQNQGQQNQTPDQSQIEQAAQAIASGQATKEELEFNEVA